MRPKLQKSGEEEGVPAQEPSSAKEGALSGASSFSTYANIVPPQRTPYQHQDGSRGGLYFQVNVQKARWRVPPPHPSSPFTVAGEARVQLRHQDGCVWLILLTDLHRPTVNAEAFPEADATIKTENTCSPHGYLRWLRFYLTAELIDNRYSRELFVPRRVPVGCHSTYPVVAFWARMLRCHQTSTDSPQQNPPPSSPD